jgi:hypothetical protein
MDCEKFESTLIDELYDELDELTSAASKRHVAGCARCASMLSGLNATRRIAVLEMVDVPSGLEERILAAERDEQKVVPLRGRISRAVSWAGSWAMRPQTAMAAVFLLMIGSSVFFVRSRQAKAPHSASAMVVTETGQPAATGAPEEADGTLDPNSAAQAHGAFETPKVAMAPPTPAASAGPVLALREDGKGGGGALDRLNAPGRGKDDSFEEGLAKNSFRNAGPAAGAPAAVAPEPESKPVAQAQSQAVAAPSETRTGASDFASGKAHFNNKEYDDAVRVFDGLAAGGDMNSALWAARSVRQSSGCANAVSRFDQVAARAYGTAPGYDATFEGGQCYRIMGSFDTARSHFGRLLTVPSHMAKAQAELDIMSPRGKGAVSAPARAAPKAVSKDSAY